MTLVLGIPTKMCLVDFVLVVFLQCFVYMKLVFSKSLIINLLRAIKCRDNEKYIAHYFKELRNNICRNIVLLC